VRKEVVFFARTQKQIMLKEYDKSALKLYSIFPEEGEESLAPQSFPIFGPGRRGEPGPGKLSVFVACTGMYMPRGFTGVFTNFWCASLSRLRVKKVSLFNRNYFHPTLTPFASLTFQQKYFSLQLPPSKKIGTVTETFTWGWRVVSGEEGHDLKQTIFLVIVLLKNTNPKQTLFRKYEKTEIGNRRQTRTI